MKKERIKLEELIRIMFFMRDKLRTRETESNVYCKSKFWVSSS